MLLKLPGLMAPFVLLCMLEVANDGSSLLLVLDVQEVLEAMRDVPVYHLPPLQPACKARPPGRFG